MEKSLLRCLEWSQQGRHRKVLREVEDLLPRVRGEAHLEAQLLIWKAQALLAMGCADRALPAASDSWDLEISPHACHLMSAALASLGEADRAEDLLRTGARLFPGAVHLPVQLAMMLTDQGRLPEALDVLQDIDPDDEDDSLPDDFMVFVLGLEANILANLGRWGEADGILREGLVQHPDSALLEEARSSLGRAWGRELAERRLARSWHRDLEDSDGADDEIAEAIQHHAAMFETPPLVGLAARRLWQAFSRVDPVRPQAPDPWAVALIAAVWQLDGNEVSLAAVARSIQVSPSTVRSALRRIRAYLDGLDPEFAHRAFATVRNPRLDETASDEPTPAGVVVSFPGAREDP